MRDIGDLPKKLWKRMMLDDLSGVSILAIMPVQPYKLDRQAMFSAHRGKQMRRLLFTGMIFLAFALAAGPAISAQKGAVLKGGISKFTPFSSSISVYPAAVDGKIISSLFSSNFKNGIPPGTHNVELSLYFVPGFGDVPWEGRVNLTATLNAGQTYKTVGNVEKRKVSVWIMDVKTKKRASNVVSFTMKDCPVRIGLCLF